jgi:MoxR-like ATPase
MFVDKFDRLVDNVETFIRGKRDVIRLSLVCMLSEGHLLIDDIPGVGKTSLAKAIANSIHGTMTRIQFTPDLLPTDVTGVQIYIAAKGTFEFHEGPVFANIVLADEINRASPKTQSSLLEVMEERQVTVDSVTFRVPRPFVVMATQNPVEFDGTYHLPEAQIDRFMMRMSIGYPDHEAEVEVLGNRSRGGNVDDVQPVLSIAEVSEMIEETHQVHVAPPLLGYVATIASATRRMEELRLGVSPRGGLALVQASQAYAAAQGRHFVTPDDIKAMTPYVLGHRMLLTSEAELEGRTAEGLIAQVLASVPVPQERVQA